MVVDGNRDPIVAFEVAQPMRVDPLTGAATVLAVGGDFGDATDLLVEGMPAPGEPTDGDGDLFPDGIDNCPDVANPDQNDANADGTGDVCQLFDFDLDGIPDTQDNCPDFPNPPVRACSQGQVGQSCTTNAIAAPLPFGGVLERPGGRRRRRRRRPLRQLPAGRQLQPGDGTATDGGIGATRHCRRLGCDGQLPEASQPHPERPESRPGGRRCAGDGDSTASPRRRRRALGDNPRPRGDGSAAATTARRRNANQSDVNDDGCGDVCQPDDRRDGDGVPDDGDGSGTRARRTAS